MHRWAGQTSVASRSFDRLHSQHLKKSINQLSRFFASGTLRVFFSCRLRKSARRLLPLLAVFLIVAFIPLALYVQVDSKNSVAVNSVVVKNRIGQVTVQAAGRGKPFLNLQNGRAMSAEDSGNREAVAYLQNGTAQARALASADFDHNGRPDVIAAYVVTGWGVMTLQCGNPDTFAPTNDSVFPR